MSGAHFDFLMQRQEEGNPISVGLIGVGQMGAGIVAQSGHLPGLRVVAAADVDVDRAARALERVNGEAPESVEDLDAAVRALLDGRAIATRNAELVPQLPLDVVVEATGIPEVGARIGIACGLARRNLISMNVEADVAIGRFLRRFFELSGTVYTLAAGDEPAVAFELVDFARTIGLEVVVAGKGKNNPLRPDATASSLQTEAESKHMNPRMLAAFVDGTKTMCEMAALANATGLPPDVPGMHGPPADAADLTDVFRLKEDGGLLDSTGVVDYVTGDVAPGVFVVVRSEDDDIISDLQYLKLGPGPLWALIRPYHLANLEVPMSIVRAVRDGRPTLVARDHVAEVAAVAKMDLSPGDRIDGIGGDQVYGRIWPQAPAVEAGIAPLGILEGAVVSKPVSAGTPLTFDDVELEEESVLLRAWRLQEHLDGLSFESVRKDASV